jgi:hypothetical protein
MLRYTYTACLIEFPLKRDLTRYSVCAGNEIGGKSIGSLSYSPSTQLNAAPISFSAPNYCSQNEKKNIFTALSSRPYSRNVMGNTSTVRVSLIRCIQNKRNSSLSKQKHYPFHQMPLFPVKTHLSKRATDRGSMYLYSK